ncbi:attacin-A [Drosophila tropicalis]|uniref:attacin-A n=1 Tax=Drosophila tropicalis TaxID=46794 RepID=UPI0035AB989F
MDCQATGNPKTGEASMNCGVKLGSDQANVKAGVFAETPFKGGPVTKGVYGAVNGNGHGLSVQHGHREHFGATTTVGANVSLLPQGSASSLNANAYHSHNPRLEQFGGGLNLQTPGGHAAAVSIDRIPKFDSTTVHAAGNARIYTSPSGNFQLNGTASATRHLSGPLRGKQDFGTGISGRYNF